jgi:hypothetical protein
MEQLTDRNCTMTKGWELLVEWKGGGSDWIALKDIKNANPLEVVLKSLGAAWKRMLSNIIVNELKFQNSRVDPGVSYTQVVVTREGVFEYYEMVLVYVDMWTMFWCNLMLRNALLTILGSVFELNKEKVLDLQYLKK